MKRGALGRSEPRLLGLWPPVLSIRGEELNRIRIIASAAVVIAAFALSACGGGGTTSGITSGTAQVRFINGSPDVGAIDVIINGHVVATAIAYRTITPYQSIQVGTNPLPQVAFVKTGTQVNIFPSLASGQAQTFQLGTAPGTNLSIVIEGRTNVVGSAGLNLGAFIEPTIANTIAGTYAVVFHHASPSAALASPNGLDVGSVTLASAPVYTRLGQMLFSSSTGSTQSFFGVTNQPAVVGPPGIGFYIAPTINVTPSPAPLPTTSPSPSPTPAVTPTAAPYVPQTYAQLYPGPAPPGTKNQINGVDPANVNNSLPFQSDVNLFIFAIDSSVSPSGVELIGTFSN